MNSKRKKAINRRFLVLHESGNVIYTYPTTNAESHVVSSLISAIFSLRDQLSPETMDISQTTIDDRKIFSLNEGNVIYSLIVNSSMGKEGKELLRDLTRVVKRNFPADLSHGFVEIKKKPRELTQKIESIFQNFETNSQRNIQKDARKLPFCDLCKIMGEKKVVKTFRVLLAGRNLCCVGYDQSLILKLMRLISSLWPKKLPVIQDTAQLSSIEKFDSVILIGNRDKKSSLKTKLENVTVLDLETGLDEKLGGDLLLEKIWDILASDVKGTKSILKNELISLYEIKRKMYEYISTSDEKMTSRQLKKQLANDHSVKKVSYLLTLLNQEESPLVNEVNIPSKKVQETLFFVEK